MRAYVLVRPGEIEMRQIPRPTPGPDGVVVRIRAALTCGTDVKAFLRGHPKFPMPTRFGHEFAGELVAAGARVQGFHEGDAIMAVPTAPCGSCYYCGRKQENLCPQVMENIVLGAYAEYIELPAPIVQTNMYHKPRSLAYAEAALLEPLACVLHGLLHVPLRADDTVVIIGGGGIAQLHVLTLRARGVRQVVVVMRGESRLEQIRRVGAAEVLVGDVAHARDAILRLTHGRGADVVIECTGQVAVWECAPGLARRGGRVVLFGGCPSGTVASFDTARLHYDQVALISPFHFTARDVRDAHELLATGGLGGQDLITAEYPLEALPEALARHQRGDGTKFAIIPSMT